MKNVVLSYFLFFSIVFVAAQEVMSPEKLIQLNKVSGKGITADGLHVVYTVSQYSLASNTTTTKSFKIPITGGNPIEVEKYAKHLSSKKIAPNGLYEFKTAAVKLKNVAGTDFYSDVPEANVQIYDALNYRHWDTWEDGKFDHVFYKPISDSEDNWMDIMPNEPFDCPTKPFGGLEDIVWSPLSKSILYVAKKEYGTAYAVSTNTDIYEYNLETKTTQNLTAYNKGYDTHPAFSKKGQLAWLQMKRDGYEADKNDLIVNIKDTHINLTANWDETVDSFIWQDKGEKIYFIAPTFGTMQLFEITIPTSTKKTPKPVQLTNGQFDISAIVGQVNDVIVVSRRDMNHASELFTVHLKSNEMKQLTH